MNENYYLIAIPSDDWLLSNEGFGVVLSQRQNELENTVHTKLSDNGLDWSTLKYFSVEDFSTVIHDGEVGLKKGANKVFDGFCAFKQYSSECLKEEEKKAILHDEIKSVSETLLKIANGQMMHFIYVPENAYIKNGSIDKGLIIDLQELEYISVDDAERLANYEMDTHPIILSDPYNVNGLEFKGVILVGTDEGRLPQNTGVSDISANYIKYIAFNQLYLASSRAKYRLILLGNSLHGVSSCLQYAIEGKNLEISS